MEKIKVGVSSCLLGNEVRYNGGHQLNRFIRDVLGQYMDFVPVCPEVECGMPIPRETLRLVGDADNPRLMTSKSGVDHTRQMQTWAARRLRALEQEDLCGFIFKKGSPSSGLFRVKVYSEKGMPATTGSGIFARAFVEHFPLLPVEEDGRLNDPRLRENFIESVFVFKHFREMLTQPKSRRALVDFHTRHKLLLLSHHPESYRAMGRFIANLPDSLDAAYEQYLELLSRALSYRTTVKKHCNVLYHVLGYFKKELSSAEKEEMVELIGRYHEGDVPLIVPITLLNHYVRKYDQPYLRQQYYLNPHPLDLRLRSQV